MKVDPEELWIAIADGLEDILKIFGLHGSLYKFVRHRRAVRIGSGSLPLLFGRIFSCSGGFLWSRSARALYAPSSCRAAFQIAWSGRRLCALNGSQQFQAKRAIFRAFGALQSPATNQINQLHGFPEFPEAVSFDLPLFNTISTTLL